MLIGRSMSKAITHVAKALRKAGYAARTTRAYDNTIVVTRKGKTPIVIKYANWEDTGNVSNVLHYSTSPFPQVHRPYGSDCFKEYTGCNDEQCGGRHDAYQWSMDLIRNIDNKNE